jgi:nicotinate-nucleotide--dimethylbenzimidazole phosphoribosyltransferase
MSEAKKQEDNLSVDFDEIRVVFKNMTDIYAAGEHKIDIPAHISTELQALCHWLSSVFVQAGKHRLENAKMVLFHANNELENVTLQQADLERVQKLRAGLIEGESALNYLCQAVNCSLQLYELDPETPVPHKDGEDTMSVQEASMALTYGMMSVEQQTECLVAHAFGNGTKEAAARLIEKSETETDIRGLDLLSKYGNRELAALCGSLIAARLSGVPAIIHGVVGKAAMSILAQETPNSISHCYFIADAQDVQIKGEQDWPIYNGKAAAMNEVQGADMLHAYGHLKFLATLLKAEKDGITC